MIKSINVIHATDPCIWDKDKSRQKEVPNASFMREHVLSLIVGYAAIALCRHTAESIAAE